MSQTLTSHAETLIPQPSESSFLTHQPVPPMPFCAARVHSHAQCIRSHDPPTRCSCRHHLHTEHQSGRDVVTERPVAPLYQTSLLARSLGVIVACCAAALLRCALRPDRPDLCAHCQLRPSRLPPVGSSIGRGGSTALCQRLGGGATTHCTSLAFLPSPPPGDAQLQFELGQSRTYLHTSGQELST